VAFALRDAADAGVIDGVVVPRAGDTLGYSRSVWRLRAFGARLHAAFGAEPPTVAVLLVESGLWARFTPGPGGYQLTAHGTGAETGDVVLITGESALAAVLDGRLAASEAIGRGLVEVDTEAGAAARVRRVLAG
jgi:hypothetical protein